MDSARPRRRSGTGGRCRDGSRGGTGSRSRRRDRGRDRGRGRPETRPTPTDAALPALPAEGQASDNVIRGLRQGATTPIPALLGQPATTLTVDLDQFQPDGDSSWTRTVAGLRDYYGPFILAYLEALVRISDWRASGGRELPTA
ncbi:MAG TPA: hypothetical protein VII59_17785 [Streptosporangiaceae bacterium]